ncbi:hypothetical protein [Geobacillus sp. YF-1]|uniref:hypothetical protein n=1 Tax=Geobacillus sp. YF-1 TaxID=3457480 RepID=UPI004045A206
MISVMQYYPIIEEVVKGIYAAYPELLEKYGERGKQKCFEDNQHHFAHLETAYLLRNAKVFTDYALWLNNILVNHGMKTDHLLDNFRRIEQAIRGRISPPEKEAAFLFYLQEAQQLLQQLHSDQSSFG